MRGWMAYRMRSKHGSVRRFTTLRISSGDVQQQKMTLDVRLVVEG